MSLEIDVRVHNGAFRLDAALDAAPGEVLAILGPNGSGKSTLLGAIAGHLRVAAGNIRLSGRTVHTLPAERRRIGLLGQRAMLFPHLTALENVAFGPRAQGVDRRTARARALDRLAQVGLGDLAHRRPADLSGGQQQRVALARALAAEPDALLLDEPFAALDAQTATQARRLVAEQRDRIGVPILLVTHDPMDAVVLAERTAVLQTGQVVQQGTTREVLGHPTSSFVAAVAGVNLLTGAVGDDGVFRMPGHDAGWIDTAAPLSPGTPATAVFSPASVRVHAADCADGGHGAADQPNRWTGTVDVLEPAPGGLRITTVEHPEISVLCPSTTAVSLGIRPGIRLAFSLTAADVSLRASTATVLR